MAIIQDLINYVPSWQKHLDESGYLKAPGQTNYHQKAGYNFKENFPNTPGYLADALGKAYQYGTEGIGSIFSNSTFPEAMARAKEESRLNSLGFRGQGFDMNEYNQTMDFARNGLNNTNIGLTYGSAQASDLTDLERDFPGMSTGDITDSMNNRPFIGNQQTGIMQQAPQGFFDDNYGQYFDSLNSETDDEQVDYLPGQSSFKDKISNIGNSFMQKSGIGGLLGLITGNPILGLIGRGIGALANRAGPALNDFKSASTGAQFFQNLRDRRAREDAAARGAAKANMAEARAITNRINTGIIERGPNENSGGGGGARSGGSSSGGTS